MKVYCMCNRCVTLVKKKKKKHIQGVLVVKTCWALTLRCVSSQYERTEKHFCLMNTGFYVFLFCTYISTFVLDWNFGNKKKILAPFFISTLSSAVKTKLDLLVHFVNNQSLCVCLCGNPISQALDFSLWMSCSLSHMVSFSVYSILSSRGTCFDRVHAQHCRALPTF